MIVSLYCTQLPIFCCHYQFLFYFSFFFFFCLCSSLFLVSFVACNITSVIIFCIYQCMICYYHQFQGYYYYYLVPEILFFVLLLLLGFTYIIIDITINIITESLYEWTKTYQKQVKVTFHVALVNVGKSQAVVGLIFLWCSQISKALPFFWQIIS